MSVLTAKCSHGKIIKQNCTAMCVCGHTCANHLPYTKPLNATDRYCNVRVDSKKGSLYAECECTYWYGFDQETAHG